MEEEDRRPIDGHKEGERHRSIVRQSVEDRQSMKDIIAIELKPLLLFAAQNPPTSSPVKVFGTATTS